MITNEANAKRFYGTNYENRLAELQNDLKGIPENIASALDAMTIVNLESYKNNWGSDDWKIGNIMQRDNGDIVLIDPVWEGWNPYMEAEKRRQDEFRLYDYSDEGEYKAPLIQGGKLPKKIKKKITHKLMLPQLKYPNPTSDDYPF
jgi:hypothetical protein